MNKHVLAIGFLALVLSGCQSLGGSSLPAGMTPGTFSRMACADGRTFAVRVAEDGKSARVRALHGASELPVQADGTFDDGSYKLNLRGEGGPSLWHKGKAEAQNCRIQA